MLRINVPVNDDLPYYQLATGVGNVFVFLTEHNNMYTNAHDFYGWSMLGDKVTIYSQHRQLLMTFESKVIRDKKTDRSIRILMVLQNTVIEGGDVYVEYTPTDRGIRSDLPVDHGNNIVRSVNQDDITQLQYGHPIWVCHTRGLIDTNKVSELQFCNLMPPDTKWLHLEGWSVDLRLLNWYGSVIAGVRTMFGTEDTCTHYLFAGKRKDLQIELDSIMSGLDYIPKVVHTLLFTLISDHSHAFIAVVVKHVHRIDPMFTCDGLGPLLVTFIRSMHTDMPHMQKQSAYRIIDYICIMLPNEFPLGGWDHKDADISAKLWLMHKRHLIKKDYPIPSLRDQEGFLDGAFKEWTVAKRVINSLATLGDSKFMRDVKNLKRKRR